MYSERIYPISTEKKKKKFPFYYSSSMKDISSILLALQIAVSTLHEIT